jgi:hypothetical protein
MACVTAALNTEMSAVGNGVTIVSEPATSTNAFLRA